MVYVSHEDYLIAGGWQEKKSFILGHFFRFLFRKRYVVARFGVLGFEEDEGDWSRNHNCCCGAWPAHLYKRKNKQKRKRTRIRGVFLCAGINPAANIYYEPEANFHGKGKSFWWAFPVYEINNQILQFTWERRLVTYINIHISSKGRNVPHWIKLFFDAISIAIRYSIESPLTIMNDVDQTGIFGASVHKKKRKREMMKFLIEWKPFCCLEFWLIICSDRLVRVNLWWNVQVQFSKCLSFLLVERGSH